MSEQRVARHKAVYFRYLVKDEYGETTEQSDLPVGYVHGVGSALLEKLEKALEGHVAGDVIEVPISPEEGFGPYDPDLTFTDDVENVPPQLRQVGAEAEMQNEAGEVRKFIVTKIEDGKLTVDGNHPYADKNVVFKLTITEVRDATPQEIATGYPTGQAPPTAH